MLRAGKGRKFVGLRALSVPSAGGFSPADLFAGDGGFVWDWSDTSTVFQDETGTTPWTTSGQFVGYILDKSGNGNHFQSQGTERPRMYLSGGLYYLDFDGVDDRGAAIQTIDYKSSNKCCTFWAYKAVSPAIVGLGWGNGDNVNVHHEMSYSAAVQRLGLHNSADGYVIADIDSAPFFTAQHLVSYQCDLAGATAADKIVVRKDGASASVTYYTNSTIGTTFVNSSFGLSAISYGFQGRMYGGFVQIARALTADEVTATETWLNERSGAY